MKRRQHGLRARFFMAGHLGTPPNLGETQSGLLEIWVLASRSSRNWSQNETNGTPSGRIIFKYFICQIEFIFTIHPMFL